MSNILNNFATVIGTLSNDRSATVIIGPWTLSGVEQPSPPQIAGQQQMVIHRLMGGDKRIDIVGDSPSQLRLTGLLMGPTCQARYALMERARAAGKQIALSIYNYSKKVLIVGCSAVFGPNSAWCQYDIVLELPPTQIATTSTTSTLNSLLKGDTATSLSSITSAVSSAASALGNVVSKATSIVGQVTPIASMIGAGGVFAKVETSLSGASNALAVTSEISGIPSALSSFSSNVKSTVSGLSTALSDTGANMAGITVNSGSSLATVVANTAAHANTAAAQGYAARMEGITS